MQATSRCKESIEYRPLVKKKRNLQNDARIKTSIEAYIPDCSFSERSATYSLGAHTEALQFTLDDNSDDYDDVDSTPSATATATATASVTAAAATATPEPDMRDVCLIAPHSGVALDLVM